MSAPSSRPPVPRPTVRKSAPPPSPAAASVAPPPPAAAAAPESTRSAPPSTPVIAALPKAYADKPPVIRDRMPTLELADDDLVEDKPAARRSTPPPPPPTRSTVVPKMIGAERAVPKIAPMPLPAIDESPVAPDSHVQLRQPAAAQVQPQPQPQPMAQPMAQVRTLTPVQAISPAPAAAKPKLDSMLDPSEALFDGMYELNYADSQWQAARLCATALGRALGARTVIVHAHDLATRELRTIGVHGEGEFDLLGGAEGSDDDLVASAVICNEKPVTMRFEGELPRLAPKRLGLIAAPRTLVAIPVMAWGRCVALIEIIDADERFESRVADSAAYVAERFAEFLSERAAA